MRNRPLIIALAIMGFLALGLTAMSIFNSGSEPTPQPTTVATATPEPVSTRQVVANRDIPPRTLITPAMLREIDSDVPNPGAFSRREDVVGTLSNADTIRQGMPILITSVVKPLQRVIPANFEVPADLRAVAIYVDANQTAAGLVDVGDHVDVLATYKLTQQKNDTERYTQVIQGAPNYVAGRTVAQDLIVLAVDRSIAQPPPAVAPSPAPGAAGATPLPGAAPPAPAAPTPTPVVAAKSRVILAARPEVAARLVAAQDSGTLYVTIRNPNSREQVVVPESREYPSRVVNVPKPRPVAPPREFQQPAPPIQSTYIPPVPVMSNPVTPVMPSGKADVTVIRGTDKQNVSVPSG